ncbi:3089_t:CDS:1, partial [Paraglomus occultum]
RTPAKKEIEGKRKRVPQATDCPFRVRASHDSVTGLWHTLDVKLEHNHQMVSAEQRRFMASERELPEDVKAEILLLKRSGLHVSQIRSVLATKFTNRVTWIYNDLYNFLHNSGSLTNKEFDAQEFIDTLKYLQADYPELAFDYQCDPLSNRLQHVIWMFPEQRMAYSRFYDVVVFDNTYSTNRFSMPFGIFSGVNNYGQSVCFAGALMTSETAESFVWIFESFLKLVNNHSPGVLLTDNDNGISSAFNQTFALFGSKHRLCLWHLFKNVMKNLQGVLGSDWSKFSGDFYACIRETDEQTFLEKWEALKQDHVHAVKYLAIMEKTKEKWAPCYLSDIFLAGMTTTQRGESMNALLKHFFDANTSLKEFLEAFASAVESRKEAEDYAAFKENNLSTRCKSGNPFEEQANCLYTRYAFYKIQEQIHKSMNYKCIIIW